MLQVRKLLKWFGVRRFALFILLFITLVILISQRQTQSGVMRVAFLDVGQGDSVLVTSPTGRTMLYDAGVKDGPVVARLGDELSFWKKEIDVCIASHPDADHVGGFINVLAHYKCRMWIDGHTFDHTGVWKELEHAIDDNKSRRATATRGTQIVLGGGVIADVIWPKEMEASSWREVDTNSRSVTLRIAYASTSVFLSGDLPINEENILAKEYGSNLESTIFKAGHHGSKTSSGKLLLDVVRPKLIVVSYGFHNRYGHPHAEAIERMKATGAAIYETVKRGTIHFECSTQKCSLDN